MQVLSCASAQAPDSFPIMRRGISRSLDTDLYGETIEKDSWGRRSLWQTRRFRVNSRTLGSSECELDHRCANHNEGRLAYPHASHRRGDLPLAASARPDEGRPELFPVASHDRTG